jgi:Cu-Zn family superoxide dismutase
MKMTRKAWTLISIGALVALATGAFALSAGADTQHARARLSDVNGHVVGVVKLSITDGKIGVKASVEGLSPGFHGFHIHSTGTCNPSVSFTTAGGHFNPTGATHGGHAGDQPVLLVNTDGTAELRFTSDRYAMPDLFDADGSAFIVHALADNYANIPTRYLSSTPPQTGQTGPDTPTLSTGDAGGRVACGVIES